MASHSVSLLPQTVLSEARQSLTSTLQHLLPILFTVFIRASQIPFCRGALVDLLKEHVVP